MHHLEHKNPEAEKIKISGILSHIRHPLYAGTLLLAVGYFMVLPSAANFLSVILIILYTLIGMNIEEKKIISEFWAEYELYMKRVPALIPGFKFYSRGQKNDKSK